jgi:hypothetical protein
MVNHANVRQSESVQEFSSCGKPRSRKPKRPLNEHYQRQGRQREKQLRENDFSPVIGVEKLLRPEYQQNSAERFEDSARPRLDGSVT